MKAKSRKRLLISSVAMLLVAMLALGTATFAWFTTDINATAQGINVQTTKPSSILVSKYDFEFKSHVNYGFSGKTLTPASSADGEDWYGATATNSDSYEAAEYSALSNIDEVGPNGAYVIKEMFNVKNAGDATVQRLKIDITTSNFNSPLLRVALIPCTDPQSAAPTKTDGVISDTTKYPAITSAQFTGNIYGSGSANASASAAATSSTRTVNPWFPIETASGVGAVSETALNVQGTIPATLVSNLSLTAGQVKSYMLLIWFEGQDVALFDATQAALTLGNITFTVSQAAATP